MNWWELPILLVCLVVVYRIGVSRGRGALRRNPRHQHVWSNWENLGDKEIVYPGQSYRNHKRAVQERYCLGCNYTERDAMPVRGLEL